MDKRNFLIISLFMYIHVTEGVQSISIHILLPKKTIYYIQECYMFWHIRQSSGMNLHNLKVCKVH